MMPFFDTKYGNPSSIHRMGGSLKKHIDKAREQVAAFLHAKPSEIVFTSCGSESDNQAIQGFCDTQRNHARLVTSTVEHPAVLNCCRHMAKRGIPLIEIGVDNQGSIDRESLDKTPIDAHTLVSIMWANNETGIIFPIPELAALVKEKGGFFHTDAVQVAGKIPLDLEKTPVDMLSLSGHKLHAPKGIGILYIREGVKISPLIYGGHQEYGLRAGTENIAYIVGLGKACELAGKNMKEENSRVRMLRDRLEKEILSQCQGAHRNGHPDHRLPNTTNISFEFIEGESILLLLDEHGIAASSGSACTTGSLEPSHVMKAMGIPYTLAHSSIRFSLSVYNTEKDIDAVTKVLPGIVDRLRKLSPFV